MDRGTPRFSAVHSIVTGKVAALDGLTRWPVTMSYFERKPGDTGDRTPSYTMSFELYENGISRALMLDYGNFVVRGDLISLRLKKRAECR